MWDKLKAATKPIVLYGTGNAAEKIIDELNKRNIAIAGIFASDGFVRSRSFAGFPVLSYAEAKQRFGDMIVLLSFGSHLQEVIENILLINDEQELYAPDLPIAGGELFTAQYKKDHLPEILSAEALFDDAQSRTVFRNVIDYKISGEIKYLLGCESDDNENWAILNPNSEDVFLDLGAYNGDTVRQFLAFSGYNPKKVIAVEPESRNFRKLSEFVDSFCSDNGINKDRFELINKAVGKEDGTVYFSKAIGRGGAVGKGKGSPVEMTSVDELLAGRDVSFIKMDLEGQEPFALEGAKETIRRCKPKLLISAYHRSDDLWKLPNMIKELNPDYKLYLRKSPCIPAWEINIYAK